MDILYKSTFPLSKVIDSKYKHQKARLLNMAQEFADVANNTSYCNKSRSIFKKILIEAAYVTDADLRVIF